MMRGYSDVTGLQLDDKGIWQVSALPGVGPVVAAGWLAATLAGAATGAVVGGALVA